MKNYMSEVAKLLGVELGERFKVKEAGTDNTRNSVYKLTEKGLYITANCDGEERTGTAGTELVKLLTGRDEIVKLPWKPKYLQTYYYVAVDGKIQSRAWLDNTSDIIFYAYGDCFLTKSEAETHAPEILKKMKEVLEICD